MKSQQQINNSINAFHNENGIVTNNPNQIVSLLNNKFQYVFVRDNDFKLPSFASRINKNLELDGISYKYIINRLECLNTERLRGSDLIKALILKNCAYGTALPLAHIFTASTVLSELPVQ